MIDPTGNGQSYSVYCDMETDGGGWTRISEIGATFAPEMSVAIDDLGLTAYGELLFVDTGSTRQDFDAPFDNYWDWSGYDLARNAFALSDTSDVVTWHASATEPAWRGCWNSSRMSTLPASDYTVLAPSILGSCYYYGANYPDWCGSVVKVTIPAQRRLVGFSDVESISDSCASDNSFSIAMDVYVR